MSSLLANERSTPGESGPFCWQSIFILRHLRELGACGNGVSTAALRSVYLALTEIAADKRNPKYSVSITEIAGYAGLGYRTVWSALEILREAGFLVIESNTLNGGKVRTSHTYTLVSHNISICKFCISICNSSPAVLQESEEEQEKKKKRGTPFVLPIEEWVKRAEKQFPGRSDLRVIGTKMLNHYGGSRKHMTYERFAEWVQTEHNPQFFQRETPEVSEPSGWKKFLAVRYPPEDYPNRERWELGEWLDISKANREMLLTEMARNAAREAS